MDELLAVSMAYKKAARSVCQKADCSAAPWAEPSGLRSAGWRERPTADLKVVRKVVRKEPPRAAKMVGNLAVLTASQWAG